MHSAVYGVHSLRRTKATLFISKQKPLCSPVITCEYQLSHRAKVGDCRAGLYDYPTLDEKKAWLKLAKPFILYGTPGAIRTACPQSNT